MAASSFSPMRRSRISSAPASVSKRQRCRSWRRSGSGTETRPCRSGATARAIALLQLVRLVVGGKRSARVRRRRQRGRLSSRARGLRAEHGDDLSWVAALDGRDERVDRLLAATRRSACFALLRRERRAPTTRARAQRPQRRHANCRIRCSRVSWKPPYRWNAVRDRGGVSGGRRHGRLHGRRRRRRRRCPPPPSAGGRRPAAAHGRGSHDRAIASAHVGAPLDVEGPGRGRLASARSTFARLARSAPPPFGQSACLSLMFAPPRSPALSLILRRAAIADFVLELVAGPVAHLVLDLRVVGVLEPGLDFRAVDVASVEAAEVLVADLAAGRPCELVAHVLVLVGHRAAVVGTCSHLSFVILSRLTLMLFHLLTSISMSWRRQSQWSQPQMPPAIAMPAPQKKPLT